MIGNNFLEENNFSRRNRRDFDIFVIEPEFFEIPKLLLENWFFWKRIFIFEEFIIFFGRNLKRKFRFFRVELGIEAECAGIYDGKWKSGNGEELTSICPINGRPIAKVKSATMAEYDQVVNAARDAFKENVKNNFLSKFPKLIKLLTFSLLINTLSWLRWTFKRFGEKFRPQNGVKLFVKLEKNYGQKLVSLVAWRR